MTVADVSGAFKDALVAAATTACTKDGDYSLDVRYGAPGKWLADDIVSVGDLDVTLELVTMSTRAQREATMTATVTISVYRGGGEDQERVAGDRAFALLNMLEEYCRVTDPTLGGLVRDCWCTAHTSSGETRRDLIAKGRTIEVEATFRAHARITS